MAKVTEISFKSFENVAELIEALESLVKDAQSVAVGQKLTAHEIEIGINDDADLAVLTEDILTDGSKVYSISLQ